MVTHQMEEVERLCDRVILLKDGTSRAYGTVSDVQDQFGGTVYRVSLRQAPCQPRSCTTSPPTAPGPLTWHPSTAATETAVLRELINAGVGVRSFTTERVSLEEIFISVYGEQNELAEA